MHKVSDCIFEIHQLWQSGFRRVYSNCCCSCSFEPEIIRIGQLSHEKYSNKILNFHLSTTILNACTKSLKTYWRHLVDSFLISILFLGTNKFILPPNEFFWLTPNGTFYWHVNPSTINLRLVVRELRSLYVRVHIFCAFVSENILPSRLGR